MKLIIIQIIKKI